MITKTKSFFKLTAILLALLASGVFAKIDLGKTKFDPYGTVVTSDFCQSIYGQGPDGGHKHDGLDKDGSAGKIDESQLADSVITRFSSDMFIGDIRMYAGRVPPTGFRLCNGLEVPNRPEFAAYRSWVDDPINGVTHLNVNGIYHTPKMCGLIPIAAGSGTDENGVSENFELNSTGGEYAHTLGVGTLPYHQHWMEGSSGDLRSGSRVARSSSNAGGGGAVCGDANSERDEFQFHDNRNSLTNSIKYWLGVNSGSNVDEAKTYRPEHENVEGHNNVPPYYALNFIIRTIV